MPIRKTSREGPCIRRKLSAQKPDFIRSLDSPSGFNSNQTLNEEDDQSEVGVLEDT